MRLKLYFSVYSCIRGHARSTSYFIIVYPIETTGFCRMSWILPALKRIDTMFPCRTAGIPVPSFSSRASCDQRMEDCLKNKPTKPALVTEYTPWFSSVPLMSSNCQSRGLWRTLERSSCMTIPNPLPLPGWCPEYGRQSSSYPLFLAGN